MFKAWITGSSIEALKDIYGDFLERRKIEGTCNYSTQMLSNISAWAMQGVVRFLERQIDAAEITPLISYLSLFSYYGVNSVPAVMFAMIGVERIDSLRLGLHYLELGKDDFQMPILKLWARMLGREGITKIIRGEDNREVDPEIFRILRVLG